MYSSDTDRQADIHTSRAHTHREREKGDGGREREREQIIEKIGYSLFYYQGIPKIII